MEQQPDPEVVLKGHTPGSCWCRMQHSVPGAEELNIRARKAGTPQAVYDAMIRRTEGQEDPLVQEPKK